MISYAEAPIEEAPAVRVKIINSDEGIQFVESLLMLQAGWGIVDTENHDTTIGILKNTSHWTSEDVDRVETALNENQGVVFVNIRTKQISRARTYNELLLELKAKGAVFNDVLKEIEEENMEDND